MWHDRVHRIGVVSSPIRFALTFLIGCPVVRAPLALAVVGAGPAVSPLGTARVLARPVALRGQPVAQGELGAAPAVLAHPTDKEGVDPRGAAPEVHASHAVTMVRRGAAVPEVGKIGS